MELKEIRNLFDDENYDILVKELNPYKKIKHTSYEILFYLKSMLALNDFKIQDISEVKKLFLYYWYLKEIIEFDGARFALNLHKTVIFLEKYNKCIQKLYLKDKEKYILNFELFGRSFKDMINPNIGASHGFVKLYYKVDTFEDFFFYLLYRYSQLYAFKGEHFPFFKWLTNEIANDYLKEKN